MSLEITLADGSYSDWNSIFSLLVKSFAYMDGRIDPPSSIHHLTPKLIASKAQDELLFFAMDGAELVGCVFAAPQTDSVYVGKLAVHPDHQRRGIGRRLMDAVEHHTVEMGIDILVLNTRIELIENHHAFKSMGYVVTGEYQHDGYDRTTYISMRKALAKQ